MEPLKLSEFIKMLSKELEENGDMPVCVRKDHDYWGDVDTYLYETDFEVGIAKTDGPKVSTRTECLIINVI